MTRPATGLLLTALLWLGHQSSSAAGQETVTKVQETSITDRLPPKIHRIQKELPAWLKKTGNKDALELMQKLDKQIKAKQFEDAETTADSLLKLMGASVPKGGPAGEKKPGNVPKGSAEEITKRLTEKVERVSAGAQEWAASGRDPAEIVTTMQEQFQPLMAAGKVVEAEAVLDRLLKRLGADAPAAAKAVPADEPNAEERVLTRIHAIQKELPAWLKKTGRKAETDPLMQTLKEQLASMNFAEAETTADTLLELMGISLPQATPIESPATEFDAKRVTDPFAAFFPHQLVLLGSERIALTPQQRDALLVRVNKTQPRLEENKTALERESAALMALTSQERMDESAVLTQLNKFLDVEREAKQLQAGLGVMINNLLTPEQQLTLRELNRTPGTIKMLEKEFHNRLTQKVARIEAEAQKWARSGRDPSSIAHMMEQKVRPLMDSGRVFEAEIEIDRVLEQFDGDQSDGDSK